MVINDMFNVVFGSSIGDDLAGISRYDGVVRDIEIDVGARCDHHITSDLNSSDHDCVGADPDAVSDLRHAFAPPAIDLPDHDSRREIDVAPQPGLGMDGEVSKVADVESRADLGVYRNLEAIPVTVVLEQEAVKKSARNTQKARPLACRLAFAQKVSEAETGSFAKRLPERSAIIAPTVAPEVSANRRFEIYRQCISRGFKISEIVSRSGAGPEAQNEIAKNILPEAGELKQSNTEFPN